MEDQIRQKAATMILEQCKNEGRVTDAKQAAEVLGRNLTIEEVHQLFLSALRLDKFNEAMKVASSTFLSEEAVELLFRMSSTPTRLLKTLEITKRVLTETEFHRYVGWGMGKWGSRDFIIKLCEKTGYQLNKEEKKTFFEQTLRFYQKSGSGAKLSEELEFLSSWIQPEEAERFYKTLERFKDSTLANLMTLVSFAKGRVQKERILKQSLLYNWRDETFELIVDTLKVANKESLTAKDCRQIFSKALKRGKYSIAAKIARTYPQVFKKEELNGLIWRLMDGAGQDEAVLLAESAAKAGRLDKTILENLSKGDHSIHRQIDICALALKQNVNIN